MRLHQYEKITAFLFFVLCFGLIYPDLFLLKHAPMFGGSFTLKDPTVSWTTFIPSFREFRYELFEHGNILWSNLRGMGQPMLGNGIQGAPLFPLNLALLGLPDLLYWSVMPIARVILIALASYLIARKIFGLSIQSSLLFALLIGFNINVVRWMNHPWTNGFLAGLWYFYFLCRITLETKPKSQTILSIALIVSIFAMLTAGFPEATALSALIVIFMYSGFAISNWPEIRNRLGKIAVLLIIGHLIGFFLSSIQLFSLIEYVQYSGTLNARSDFSAGAYTSEQSLTYWLAQISGFWANKKQQDYTVFSIGLFGLFFAIHGLAAIILNFAKRESTHIKNGISIMLMVSMIFFVFKAFAISTTLDQIFSKIPILGHSHFPLYFPPLFYLGAAYLSSVGFHELFINKNKIRKLITSLIAFTIVIFLCSAITSHFHNISAINFWSLTFSKEGALALQVYILISVFIIIFQFITAKQNLTTKLPTQALVSIILISVIIELNQTLPKNFSPDVARYSKPKDRIKNALDQANLKTPLPLHELRGANKNGDYTAYGLATVDNGAAAILPPKFRQLRLSLFNARYGGFRSLIKPKSAWSYNALSANIYEVHSTPITEPNWQDFSFEPSIESKVENWNSKPQPLTNPLFFEGSSTALFGKSVASEVWLHFTTQQQSFWIQANIKNRLLGDKKNNLYKITTNWRIRVPADWISEDQYNIVARVVNPENHQYHDSQSIQLIVDRNHPASIEDKKYIHLSSTDDNILSFLFNTKALPRAYIAKGCQPSSNQKEEMLFYQNDDIVMKGQVVFPYDAPTQIVPCETYDNTFSRLPIKRDDRTSLNFDTVQGPALVILNDSYYPGWRAFDSASGGKSEITIERANTNARSVYLSEPRAYKLSMEYQPPWLTWVYVLTGLGILMSLGLWWLIYRRGI